VSEASFDTFLTAESLAGQGFAPFCQMSEVSEGGGKKCQKKSPFFIDNLPKKA
jgi:hypothetical protein